MKNRTNLLVLLVLAAFVLTACPDGGSSPSTDSSSGGTQGQGGSMARFAVSGDYLYTVDQQSLNLFDISDPADPQKRHRLPLQTGVETIFPFQDKLFIGTMRGMYILSIEHPETPEVLSLYEHVTSCDPVVTDGRYAYVTLRTGNTCTTAVNQLDIVDIEDFRAPFLAKPYPMTNPIGLGIDGGLLFVCDDGLKVYDATDVMNLKLKHHFQINAYDVIPDNGQLLVVGSDGLYQYNYTGHTIKLLSKIDITPEP
ncbi:LVIVD repeat-containing protein [Pontibacter sp. CAU 1760]